MILSTLSLRAALFAGVSAVAVTAAPNAYAQGGGLDSITVTAQKREQNQQEVPISVETLSAERFADIQAAGEDIRALAARIPGLYAESSNGRYAPRFYIRGLGNVDFDLAASQPVSIVMDEVVQENVLLKSAPLFDIDQVEVLRGPQGTLFGRNTPAGVIKFVTRKPTDEFDAIGQVAYGTHNTVTAQAGIGGPLIEDLLSVRVSGLYQRRDDWIDNGFTGADDVIGGFEDLAGRVQLLFTPGDQLSVLLNVHGRDYEGTSALFRANAVDASGIVDANYDRDTVFFDTGGNNPQQTDSWGGSAKIDWDFGGATLTSITAYETTKGSSLGDIDGGTITPAVGAPVPPGVTTGINGTDITFPGFIPFLADTMDSIDDLDQFTQEIRLASNGDGALNWQAGFFYFDTDFQISTVGLFFPALSTVTHDIKSWAIFGQASYDLTDNLNITAGGRYTEEDRDFDALISGFGATVNPTNASDEDFSWDVSTLYRVNDGLNLFARVARGFRGPAIQGRDVAFTFAPAVDPQTVAQSERILSFEGGFKSEFNNRARLNATVYYYRVNDQQFSIIGGASNLNQVINADKGRAWGLEIDAEAALTDNLYVSAGFSYNNTEIDDPALATLPCGSGACTVLDPLNGFGQAIVDGNPFPNAPEITFNAFAEYTIPLRDKGEFFVNTDWAVQGKTNFLLYETAEFRSSGNFEGGARVGYRCNDGRLEGAFFARNITNEVNLKGGIDFNNNTGFFNEPRIVGFQLTMKN